MCSNPHIVAIPFPAQGHVIPLLELSQCLVKHGCKVTFVNTDYNHKRVVNALEENNCIGDQIHLVSVPDGMEPWEDRNELGKLSESMLRTMPGKLQELIEKINNQGNEIACVIGDGSIGWLMELAKKMNIRRAAFWPAATALLALSFSIPKLIDDGIINNDGTVIKKGMVRLAPNMPATNSANFVWACLGDFSVQKVIFDLMVKNNETLKMAEIMVCNSTYELEPAAFSFVPEILPVGPLLASNRLGNSAGCFWREDRTCLKWLDQQPSNSVIYVAFGSFTVFEQIQFQELALGLELSNRPFLWVVRPDFTSRDTNDAYPEGFQDRVGSRGWMVGWAPQQKVLSHPSIACFLSHCGWNSTMEGVSSGIPFLCWPYFADQFLNESYICDIWKVGLKFSRDKSGIITRKEIKTKLDRLLGDENLKTRSLALKEMTMNSVREGGHSNKTLNSFLEWINT
ncbi:hypothetical protein Ddye_001861 [Dipteronia dyeriana]|uniref:UDP-glycosyltransferase n=1 Tax=Dipteronia dyeriana TaxID=168575 RepID=A0AAD9XQ33_9ROSI|nr:hypothetical protein Ddye_001861 [Dipteronia dyeriana]